jgi:hypothetical protein
MKTKLRVLIACEESGAVRDAFIRAGHDAMSCDIKDTSSLGPHYTGNVLDVLDNSWDLMVGHPPCTYLAVSGNKWLYHPEDKHLPTTARRPHPNFPNRKQDAEDAAMFFKALYYAPIKFVALENPVSRIASMFRKSDQIIQPYQFGSDAVKATGLWLKNLPPLTPTKIVTPTYVETKKGTKYSTWWWETCKLRGEERQTARSKTFLGVAEAMAEQWGNYVSARIE